MKLASLVIAVIMSLSLAACGGGSTANQTPASQSKTVTQQATSIQSSQSSQESVETENQYDGITNDFVYPISFLHINDTKEDYDIFIGTWGDTDGSISLKEAKFVKSSKVYELIADEKMMDKHLLSITLPNPDYQEFSEFLSTVDWHPDAESSDDNPYGYIICEDSIIIVGTDDDKINLYNVKALADVMAIDIQDAVARVSSVDDAEDIVSNLIQATQLGVRGYPVYADWNPNGVIIDNYDDLLYSMENPSESQLGRVYAEINGFYDDRESAKEYYTEEDDVPPADDSIMEQQLPEDPSVYDYAFDPSAGYDFSHEPENVGELIQGFNALNENLYGNFWDIVGAMD